MKGICTCLFGREATVLPARLAIISLWVLEMGRGIYGGFREQKGGIMRKGGGRGVIRGGQPLLSVRMP